MIPTINKRFLFKVLAVTLLLSGSVYGLHAVQARRIPDALRKQADRATADGKRDAAISYLRQYLEFRPADADVQEQLAGLLKERIGNGPPNDLLFLYEKILRTDPARHAVRREALAAALRLGRHTDAATHAEELLKQFHTEAPLWRQLGEAQVGQGKSAEAVKSFEKAIELMPTDISSYLQLAQHQWGDLHQSDAARATLDRLVLALPHDPAAFLTRARFDALVHPDGKGDPADLRKALELDPENVDALVALAEHLQKNRDVLGAHDCLTDARKIAPGDTRVVRALAWLELNRGNLGASVAVLEEGLEKSKDGFDLLVPLADLLVQMGDTRRPKEIVEKLRAAKGPVPAMQCKYLVGRLAMRDQQWAAAVAALAELRTMAVNLPGLENQTDLLLAVCHQRLGDFDKELQLLQGILNRDPNHLAARGALASAHQNAGRLDDATAEYEKVIQSPYSTAESHVTLLKLRANRLRASAATTSAQWDELERTVEPVIRKLGPATTDAVRLRAEISTLRGAKERAVVVLQAEAARRPRDPNLWAALATASADFGGVPVGLAVLDEAQAIAGDGAELRLCRAALYARDPARLRPIDPLAAHIDTWPDADQLRLLNGLIEVYDRLGDDKGVIATYRRLVGRRPTELVLWEGFYERAAKAQDADAVTEARAAIARLEPTPGRAAALCTAWDAVAARNASAAPAALATLTAAFGAVPDRAEACVALARLKALSGDTSSPLELLERAVRLEPRRFAPAQEWIEFLAAVGDRTKLTAFLSRLDRDFRWAGEPIQRVVRQSMKKLEPAAAKALVDAAAPHVQWVPGGTGWLADAYHLCGATAEAGELYERAVSNRGATGDDWLRLALRAADGSTILDRAKAALTAPMYLTVAAAYRETHQDWKPDLAAADRRPFAQARLALALSRFDRPAAIGVLETFLTDKGFSASDGAWARQNLAMLLVARGNPTDRAKAKELLAGAESATGITAAEKRSTVAVLASLSRHLDGTDRTAVLDRAIQLMESVAAESKAERDRFLLAQMHRTAGHRKDSRLLLIDLLKASPANMDYMISALDDATGSDDKTFAERCAADLKRLYPDEFRVVAAVARFECRSGRPEAALALAVAHTRAADAAPNDLQLRNARAGELLDELARLPAVRRTPIGRKMTDAAVMCFELLYQTRPEAVVAVAGLLAADGRTAEAFARIEKHTTALPPRVKAMAGLAAMRSGSPTPEQMTAVRGWLATAKNEEPNSVAVLLHEGELCALTRDTAGCEAAYAGALKRDPTNVVALNNLAWTLAANPAATERVAALIDRAVREVGLTGELLDTRARMKLAANDLDGAEQDCRHALAMERTGLRLFHAARVATARGKKDDGKKFFADAVAKGLEEPMLHPADVDTFRAWKQESGK